MAHVIFWLNVLFTIGTLVIPMMKATRASACFSCISQLLAAACSMAILHEWYPGFSLPDWRESMAWTLVSWLLLISGLIIALRKPTRQQLNASCYDTVA